MAFHGPCLFSLLATQKASVKLIPLMWFPEGGKPRLLISADGVMDLSSLQPGSIGTSLSLLVEYSCWNQLKRYTDTPGRFHMSIF